MEEIPGGIRITHEGKMGTSQLDALHDEKHGSLSVYLNDRRIYLTPEETAYFLAWMATWYAPGGAS